MSQLHPKPMKKAGRLAHDLAPSWRAVRPAGVLIWEGSVQQLLGHAKHVLSKFIPRLEELRAHQEFYNARVTIPW